MLQIQDDGLVAMGMASVGRPNFIMIGASKAGTTTLWEWLRRHPDVFMANPKEPYFFSYDHVYARGMRWYESLFEHAGGAAALGEASTNYCEVRSHPGIVERIRGDLGAVRIIYCVRSPMDRIASAWKQCLFTGHPMPRAFSRAVREYPTLIEQTRYWETYKAYADGFGEENIMVVFFEDVRDRPESLLTELYGFLGVDAAFRPAGKNERRNVSSGKRVYRGWAGRLRKARLFRRLMGRSPDVLRGWLERRVLTEKMPEPIWDSDTVKYVVDELAEDTARFLGHFCDRDVSWSYGDLMLNPRHAEYSSG